MLRLFTIVSSVFQVFQTYVAIIAFECFKTRSSVASLLVFLLSRLVLTGGRSRRDVDGLAGDTRQEAAARASGRGLASGRLGARHAPKTFTTSTMGISITKMAAAQ
jgi:hypothetical protein